MVYEGYVEAPTNSFYQFILYYAGYMKIYIDGKLVVPERWRTAWNPNSYKFETPIKKGVKILSVSSGSQMVMFLTADFA